VLSIKGYQSLVIAGFLVGFGQRGVYAGGCTSGHAIYWLKQLTIASLIAVIGFFIGDFIYGPSFILPLIFGSLNRSQRFTPVHVMAKYSIQK